jgi:hypothetical protein
MNSTKSLIFSPMEGHVKNNQKVRIFSIVLILMMLLGALGMPTNLVQAAGVTLDGTPSSGTANPTSSSISFSVTTGTGTDRLMLVGASWNCGTTNRTISSVNFTPSGDSPLVLNEVFTQQYTWAWSGGGTAYRYTAIYSLLTPPSGVTGTVNISFSGAVANGIIAGAANFAGVDQTTPLGTAGGATGTSDSAAPNPSVTLTGLNGDELVFDSVFIGTNSTSQTLVADAGQSELWNVNGWSNSNSSFNTRGAASTRQATGASATMSWTAGGYTSLADRWAIAAVPIHPTSVPIQYTLTTTAGTGGTITAPPTSPTTHDAGEVVIITAAPSTGYHFVNWTGDVSTVDDVNAASTTITMNGDYSITANFAIDTHTLTVAAGTGGTITAPPSPVTTHDYGSVVSIIAASATGYHFVDWTGDVSTVDDVNAASTTITMEGDYSITANFAIDTYTLTASNDGNGSVTLDPAGGTYDYGTTVTITPVANTDYHFVSWTGPDAADIIDTDGVYTIVMDADKSVTANFAIDTYTLTVSNDGNGSVTLDPAGGTYAAGTTVTLTPVPNPDYHFVSWTGPDAADIIDTDGVYTIVMDADKSITANFAHDINYIYLPFVIR